MGLYDLLGGIISKIELETNKPVLLQVSEMHFVHGERIFKVQTMAPQRRTKERFIIYELMREYYPKEMLFFLEDTGRVNL